jgi:hypothetical protein
MGGRMNSDGLRPKPAALRCGGLFLACNVT